MDASTFYLECIARLDDLLLTAQSLYTVVAFLVIAGAAIAIVWFVLRPVWYFLR